jgi:ATP-dependent helicase/nuclease subunit A
MTSASPQIIAADPDLSVFVTANAGSGKTTTLVNRVARLLLRGVRPGDILCVTYTKAAAAEMQARLFEQLGGWAVADDADLAQQIAALDDSDPAAQGEEALSRARRLFAQALETPGGLKIQTLHAFCEKLLRRFPIEAGVSPRFTVLEDAAATALSQSARDDLARAALADPDGPVGRAYAHFAVELKWDAFQSLLGMIEAKRDALTAYVKAVDDGLARGPHELCGVTFEETPETVEAEFLARVHFNGWRAAADGLSSGSKTDQDLARTMVGLTAQTMTIEQLIPIFFVWDDKTKLEKPRARLGTKSAPDFAKAFLEEFRAALQPALDRWRAARIAADTIHVLTLAAVHAGLYEQAKAARGALDFSDLVARTVDLLTRRADAAWVLFKLDGGIDHVLIDEAQDTAPEQWAILRALTEEFFVGDGAERPSRGAGLPRPAVPRTVFAVGDEKQSIYSFQGARPERLRQESQQYQLMVEGVGRRFEPVDLALSWRSTPEVLGFVDAVFQPQRRTLALVGEDLGYVPPHQAMRAGHAGNVDLWPLFVDQPAPDPDAWDPVDAEPASSGRKRLAADLAAEIRRQVQTGAGVHDRRTGELRPAGYGDFLILVRRRDATFEEIIRALKSAGVPVAGADRLKLSSHIVFDDLIALGRFALFPGDELSLAGILRSPFCDVPDFGPADSLYELAGRDKRGDLWRELQVRADEHPAWRRARNLLAFALETRDRSPFAFISGLLNRVDETGRAGRARILDRLGREAAEAIDETLAQVLAAEGRGGVDLETCLALLEQADVEVKREMEGARAEVRVMTVHGSKGLEAPIVILPDTTMRATAQGPTLLPVSPADGAGEAWLMAPSSSKDDCTASAEARNARQDRTDAETLRLLYVALTRARDRLIVMGRVNSKGKAQDDSWWSVIAETFDRLAAETPGAVRTVDTGVLRFGADPAVLTPAAASAAPDRPALPGWALTRPAADASARFASPSKMDETLRIAAPSPLATAAGGLGRFRRGDLVHRLLERLPDIATQDRPEAALRLLARERDLTDDQRAEMIAAAFGVLDDDRFAPVFGPGSRAEVALTGTAPELPPGVRVSGRIDRLVITPDRVLVVDFKSNRPAPDSIEDADTAYVTQMAVYAAVLRRLYPDRPVEAALVWTDGPKLMAVPQALMDAALAGR